MKMAEKVRFYGLSTCMWCKKTKKLLEELGVELDITWVNELEGDAKDGITKLVGQINPNHSYPTVDFGDGVVVIGYKPDEIEKAVEEWRAKQK
jgi:glutaredoxin